jgi:hypothetical protein
VRVAAVVAGVLIGLMAGLFFALVMYGFALNWPDGSVVGVLLTVGLFAVILFPVVGGVTADALVLKRRQLR